MYTPLVTPPPVATPPYSSPTDQVDGYSMGDPDAPVVIEVWEDFQCPACRGLGVEDRVDPELLVADAARTLRQGALVITTPSAAPKR